MSVACMRGKAVEREVSGLERGRATDMCKQKQHIYTQTGKLTQTLSRTDWRVEQTDAPRHTNADLPLHPLSLCSPSLLALSCFPDSRWRPDRRAERLEVRLCDDRPGPLSVTSTLPACCLKINWQIETQNCCRSCLTHCLFTFFFFFSLLTPRSLAAWAHWL